MMTDDDRRRIWAEERFRQEVRKQISTDGGLKTRRAKVWEFLNSPLGIWFLATAVVGSLGWAYAEWEGYRSDRDTFRASVVKLDTEIEARLRGMNSYLQSRDLNQGDFSSVVISVGSRLGVYPEYLERTTRSLVQELRRLVPEKERRDFDRTLSGIDAFKKFDIPTPFKSLHLVERQMADSAREHLLKDVALQRWSIE